MRVAREGRGAGGEVGGGLVGGGEGGRMVRGDRGREDIIRSRKRGLAFKILGGLLLLHLGGLWSCAIPRCSTWSLDEYLGKQCIKYSSNHLRYYVIIVELSINPCPWMSEVGFLLKPLFSTP